MSNSVSSAYQGIVRVGQINDGPSPAPTRLHLYANASALESVLAARTSERKNRLRLANIANIARPSTSPSMDLFLPSCRWVVQPHPTSSGSGGALQGAGGSTR